MMTSSTLPPSLLLGLTEATAPLQWRLRWNWDWPLWATAFISVFAIFWVMVFYFREVSTAGKGVRSGLGLLRLTTIGLTLLMLAQPTLEWFRLGRPRLVLLVDRSASMGTMDHYPGATTEDSSDISRIVAWQQMLTAGEQALIERWQTDYQLEVVAFDERFERLVDSETSLAEQLRELTIVGETTTGGTRLGDAIDYALRELPGKPPVAIVVLTDGISTRGQTLQQAAERARRLRVPLYTVAIGSDLRRPDIAVENLLVEEIVFPGDRLQVEATVRAVGYEGKTVDVVLRDADARDLAKTTIKLPPDETPQTVRLAIRPDVPGQLSLELAIEPQDEEANTINNVARQVIEVRDEKIRVLFVQSQPSYEYRALKSLLERDPAVTLHVVLQEADADYSTVDDTALRAFPVGEQELFAYDVLILGDVDPSLLPRSVWPLVERFVTVHGGGMVGIAGPRFMPLAFQGIRSMEILLPIRLESLNPLRSQLSDSENFVVSPTTLGWQTPSLQLGETRDESQHIWQTLPPVSWMLRLDDIKPGTQVLAELPGQKNRQGQRLPVILRNYVGAGEVLFHATDETWRWRWRTDDRYFARYWGQVVRRLGRGRLAAGRQGVQLTTDRSLYKPDESIQLQARFRNPSQAPADDDEVVVQLRRSFGPPRQVTLQRRLGRRGMFVATLENLAPGKYETLLIRPNLSGSSEVARFEVRQPPRELAQVVVNRLELAEAAKISGGKSYTFADTSQLIKELPQPQQQTLAELPPRPLWNSHAIMALFVITLTCEWLLRRRYGML
ncbi:MAG: VWA domain-containing protein [Planctomycetes bacterium]|nr:VWA domain-containing protein [Planctomycetota bacterium]